MMIVVRLFDNIFRYKCSRLKWVVISCMISFDKSSAASSAMKPISDWLLDLYLYHWLGV